MTTRSVEYIGLHWNGAKTMERIKSYLWRFGLATTILLQCSMGPDLLSPYVVGETEHSAAIPQ